jgi:hypothetical protein
MASLRRSLVIALAATLVCTLSGPFETARLPLATRSLFWLVLIGFNVLKWRAWGHFMPPLLPAGRTGALVLVLGGGVLLNATLPFEINWLLAAVGVPLRLEWASTFLIATALSLVIGVVIATIHATGPARAEGGPQPPLPDVVPAPLAAPAATGLAARVNLGDLCAIVAEDHYLRLHLADGGKPLVLYRFGDALRELAGIDGLQVHRGSWVAASAVTGAVRDGRKWRLQIAGGIEVAVSESHLAAVRARGWLARGR